MSEKMSREERVRRMNAAVDKIAAQNKTRREAAEAARRAEQAKQKRRQ